VFVPSPGAAMLDNTTAFGALAALDAWPASAREWTDGRFAVHLRSLMDLLEALVLHETLVLDSGSRAYDVWPRFELPGASDALLETDLLAEGNADATRDLISSLVSAALETLDAKLQDGTFVSHVRDIYSPDVIRTLPPFYDSAEDFAVRLRDSYREYLDEETQQRLTLVAGRLSGLRRTTQTFAFFAFRAFFYYQVAQSVGMAYVPHSWRSSLVASEVDHPTRSFAQYLVRAADPRTELDSLPTAAYYNMAALRDDFPVIASFIAHRATTRRDLLEVTMETRESRSARAFRRWIAELEAHAQEGSGQRMLTRAEGELHALKSDLRRELTKRAPSERGQEIMIKIGLPPSVDVPITVRAPALLRRLTHRRRHLVFLRNALDESFDIADFAVAFQRLSP
jgi:hypothetical protein